MATRSDAGLWPECANSGRSSMTWWTLPELPHGQSHGLRIGLARGLGDDALVVQRHIGTAPETKPHSRSDPKRIRHVVLVDPIDARLSAEIVISIRREP